MQKGHDIHIFIHNICLEYSFLNKETNLELPAYTINEEVPAVFTCVQQTKRPQLHTNRGDDHINLFLTEEVRYIPYKHIYKHKHTESYCQDSEEEENVRGVCNAYLMLACH